MAKKKGGGGGRSGAGPSRPLVIEFGPRAAAAIDRVRDATAKTAGTVSDIRNRSTEGLSAAATTARDRVLAGGAYGGGSAADRAALTRAATEAATAAAAQALRDQQRAARAEVAGFGLAQRYAHDRAATMHALGLRGAGAATSRVAQFGAGLEGAGFARGGAMVSRAAPLIGAAVAAVDAAATAAAKVADQLNDRYASDAQKARRLFADIVPGGAKAMGLYDSFTGRAAQMTELQIQHQERSQANRIYAERERFQAAEYQELYGAEARAKALGVDLGPGAKRLGERGDLTAEQRAGARGAAVTLGQVDRSTAAGEREYQNKMRLLPIDQRLAQLEVQKKGASQERLTAEVKLNEVLKRQADTRRDREDLQRRVTNATTRGDVADRMWGVARAAVVGDSLSDAERAAKLSNTLERENDLAQQAKEQGHRVRDARQREIEADKAMAMARADRLRAEAANREALAESAAGRAQSLGRQDPGQRALNASLAAAARQMRPEDLAYAPDFLKQGFEAFDPAAAQKAFERAGASTPEFRQGQREAPESFGPQGSTPESLRQEAIAGGREADRAVREAEAEAATRTVDAVKSLANTIVDAIQSLESRIRLGLETDRYVRNAFGG